MIFCWTNKNNKLFLDVIKISGLAGFYFVYINISVLCFFIVYWMILLRKANNELAAIQFKQEIVKTEILEQTQRNREKMYGNNQTKKIIEIHPEIVQVPSKTELSYR